jgi:hypothetical protein
MSFAESFTLSASIFFTSYRESSCRETDGYPIYSITMDDLRAAVEEEDFFT